MLPTFLLNLESSCFSVAVPSNHFLLLPLFLNLFTFPSSIFFWGGVDPYSFSWTASCQWTFFSLLITYLQIQLTFIQAHSFNLNPISSRSTYFLNHPFPLHSVYAFPNISKTRFHLTKSRTKSCCFYTVIFFLLVLKKKSFPPLGHKYLQHFSSTFWHITIISIQASEIILPAFPH